MYRCICAYVMAYALLVAWSCVISMQIRVIIYYDLCKWELADCEMAK